MLKNYSIHCRHQSSKGLDWTKALGQIQEDEKTSVLPISFKTELSNKTHPSKPENIIIFTPSFLSFINPFSEIDQIHQNLENNTCQFLFNFERMQSLAKQKLAKEILIEAKIKNEPIKPIESGAVFTANLRPFPILNTENLITPEKVDQNEKESASQKETGGFIENKHKKAAYYKEKWEINSKNELKQSDFSMNSIMAELNCIDDRNSMSSFQNQFISNENNFLENTSWLEIPAEIIIVKNSAYKWPAVQLTKMKTIDHIEIPVKFSSFANKLTSLSDGQEKTLEMTRQQVFDISKLSWKKIKQIRKAKGSENHFFQLENPSYLQESMEFLRENYSNISKKSKEMTQMNVSGIKQCNYKEIPISKDAKTNKKQNIRAHNQNRGMQALQTRKINRKEKNNKIKISKQLKGTKEEQKENEKIPLVPKILLSRKKRIPRNRKRNNQIPASFPSDESK